MSGVEGGGRGASVHMGSVYWTYGILHSAPLHDKTQLLPNIWIAALPLTNLPDGSVPRFIRGIEKLPNPEAHCCHMHDASGSYLQVTLSPASTLPVSDRVHLIYTIASAVNHFKQTAQHVIASVTNQARRQFLLPISNTPSISTIFGTKEGAEALGIIFLVALQACIRLWRCEAPPKEEDHV